MTASNFARSLDDVLRSEGGYVNNPRDPGGATNFGITQRVFDAWRRLHGLGSTSVRYLTKDVAGQIYKRQYWDTVQADTLPVGIDYVVFDGAVNSGSVRSIRWLQKAVGVKADGMLGHITLAAVNAHAAVDVINAICDRRLSFLEALRNWRYFGRGWKNRVAFVRQQALAMRQSAMGA